jgi:hypothetical protein
VSPSVRILLVLGCIAGVIAGAAPLEVKAFGYPTMALLAAVSAALLLCGTWMRFAGDRERAAGESTSVGGSIAAAGEAMLALPAEVRALRSHAAALEPSALAAEIDQLIAKRIYPVLEAQSALVAAQGFARYASHTSPWAAGERMLYRAWSAATDGHLPEALASLDEALPHLDEAAREWAKK